jgi:DNA primase
MDITDSSFDIITGELNNLGGWQKRTADHIMIKCPFHDDGTPSCGIYIASGMSISIGSWHCFGCSARGPWNKLAKKLGLREIKDWGDYSSDIISNTISEAQTISSIAKQMRIDYSTWPKDMVWRGFSGKLVQHVGGLIAAERATSKEQSNRISALFPIYINQNLRGAVKAAMKKQKGALSYVTTKGNWVMKYGLFGYENAKRLRKDYVVLVEGPRDALRLIEYKIPAIAILGSNNFSDDKALMLSSLNINTAYCLPDNDDAGKHMRTLVRKHMSKYVKTVAIKLPPECGDPEEMDSDDIDNLYSIVE